MARTPEEYTRQLISLLPKGKLWNKARSNQPCTIKELFSGLSEELSRVETRTEDLVLIEKVAATTTELLEEMEVDFGILYDNLNQGLTFEQRRERVLAKLISFGGNHKEYFEAIADSLGWPITIEEFRPFFMNIGAMGDMVGDNYNLFYWMVWVTASYGMNWNIAPLILEFQNKEPGHTIVKFEFRGRAFSRAFSPFDFDAIQHYDNSWYLDRSFSRDFSNAFANAYDYDGENYIGSFGHAFSLAFDRASGGAYSFSEFGVAFRKPA